MLASIYNAVGPESFTKGLRELFEAQQRRKIPGSVRALKSAFDHEREIVEEQLEKYTRRP